VPAVGLETEQGSQKQQRRRGRPCLRATCRRILDWVSRRFPRVAGERLGEAVLEEIRSFQDPLRDAGRFFPETVLAQAPRDDRVVVGPDGADMVPNRVVRAFALGHGADAPAGEQRVTHQMAGNAPRLVAIDDATPEEMADVRGERVHSALVAIERQSKELAVGNPEVTVETALELGRFAFEALCPRRVSIDQAGEPRRSALGVVRVTLELAGRARQ